ncbi:MAG: F0F1 ATP synthase subunit B [Planctomycetes bacterium]|nr:F0F1 ATP synthase subunit B [Planctomycetota bacterium]
MYHRLVSSIVITMAVFCASPLLGDDEQPAQSAVAGDAEPAEGGGSAPGEETSDAAHPEANAEHGAGEDEPVHSDGGSGHHEADHDLSHANAGDKMNSPDDFRSDLAIWTFVVFVCLLAVLGKFAWGPVMEGLEKREQSIASMIDEAKQGQEQAAEQLKQYEAKLAAAGEEARDLVAQARKDAETAKDRILAEAQEAADRQRERAVNDIQVAKNVALQEMTEKSVDLAVNLAGRIVRQQLKAEDHSDLVREAMDQLPSRN